MKVQRNKSGSIITMDRVTFGIDLPKIRSGHALLAAEVEGETEFFTTVVQRPTDTDIDSAVAEVELYYRHQRGGGDFVIPVAVMMMHRHTNIVLH